MPTSERPDLNTDLFLKEGLGPENARVYRHYFGPTGWQLFTDYARWEKPSVGLDTVNNNFFVNLGVLNGLSPNSDLGLLEAHWHRQRNSARLVLEDTIRKVAPHREEVLGLLNNLKSIASPAELIRLLATPTLKEGGISPTGEKGVSLKLKQQVARQLILAILCGDFDVRSGNGKLEGKLGDINNHFEKTLFKSTNEGDSRSNVRYSYHDPITNALLSLGRESNPENPELLVYEHYVRTRIVRGHEGFDIYFNYREKSMASAVMKALAKAQLNNGKIETSSVKDQAGLLFAPLEAEPRMVKSILGTIIKNLKEFNGGVQEESPPDNLVDGQRGQSDNVIFDRVHLSMPYFEGVNLELMGYLYKNYIASFREVGRIDLETGLYDGQGRELFELRRIASGVDFLWPANLYGQDLNINVEMQKRSQEISEKLKHVGLVRS